MFENAERGGRSGNVGVHKVKQMRPHPGRHLYGERDEKENAADKRRVKKVFADAAKCRFGNDDGNKTADQRHPDRHVAG